MTDSMTINELIKKLNDVKEFAKQQGIAKPGNIKVFMSSDAEGNSYNSMFKDDSVSFDRETLEGDVVVLWPYEEYVELV